MEKEIDKKVLKQLEDEVSKIGTFYLVGLTNGEKVGRLFDLFISNQRLQSLETIESVIFELELAKKQIQENYKEILIKK